MEQPHYSWDPVMASSGLAFYHGKMFPQWEGNVLVGALRGQMLDRLEVSGDKVVAEEPLQVDAHSMRALDRHKEPFVSYTSSLAKGPCVSFDFRRT
jgi:glucose/arabinose dehydrogenase